jgi:hypothetical protein
MYVAEEYTPAFNTLADVVSIFMMTKWFHYDGALFSQPRADRGVE